MKKTKNITESIFKWAMSLIIGVVFGVMWKYGDETGTIIWMVTLIMYYGVFKD